MIKLYPNQNCTNFSDYPIAMAMCSENGGFQPQIAFNIVYLTCYGHNLRIMFCVDIFLDGALLMLIKIISHDFLKNCQNKSFKFSIAAITNTKKEPLFIRN